MAINNISINKNTCIYIFIENVIKETLSIYCRGQRGWSRSELSSVGRALDCSG